MTIQLNLIPEAVSCWAKLESQPLPPTPADGESQDLLRLLQSLPQGAQLPQLPYPPLTEKEESFHSKLELRRVDFQHSFFLI